MTVSWPRDGVGQSGSRSLDVAPDDGRAAGRRRPRSRCQSRPGGEVVVDGDPLGRRRRRAGASTKWLPMKPAPPTTNDPAQRSRSLRSDSHLVAARGERRVADQQVPDDGAQPLGVRRDVVGEQRRDRPRTRRRAGRCGRRRGRRCRRSAAPRSAAELERAHDVGRDVLARRRRRRPRRRARRPSAPSREPSQPRRERGVPALVVGPGGQLGDVVGRRVGLEVADLAEVVDGVAGVSRPSRRRRG